MISMIDAESNPVRPSEKGLNGGNVKDDALDPSDEADEADGVPPESRAERDWYEQEANARSSKPRDSPDKVRRRPRLHWR